MTDRNAVYDEIRGKLAKMKQNIRQLSARSDLMDGKAKAEVQQHVDVFREEFNALMEQYQRLVEAEDETWDEAKSEIEQRLDAAAIKIQDAWERVQ